MDPISVVVADDHPVVRQGIVNALSQTADIKVVAEISSPRDLELVLARTQATLLLLDIRMPQFSASKVVPLLKQKFPYLKILIVSAYNNPEYVLSLIKAGVHGYWLKSEDPSKLIDAIHEVMNDKSWFSASVMRTWANHKQSRIPMDDLTRRELEVLEALALGSDTDQIAESLYISPRTAHTHVKHIIAKLGASNRTDAVVKAIQRGIIEPVLVEQPNDEA
jgi:DNA-binding NarL/FixJ family response regulator